MDSVKKQLQKFLKSNDYKLKVGAWGEIKLCTSPLGEGGNGLVYAGTLNDKEQFAIKFLTLETGHLEQKKARFKAEYINAQYANLTRSVRLYQLDSINVGETIIDFYIMEKCQCDLNSYVKGENAQSSDSIKAIISNILDAVEEFHNKGIIHRDLKPQNIVFDKHGVIKICDFGIASFIGEDFADSVKTKKSERMANRLFSAPEQDYCNTPAHRTMDIYAIGQIIHFLIKNKTYRGSQHINFDANFSEYEKIVEKCLRENPDERFQSIAELRELLNICEIPRFNNRAGNFAIERLEDFDKFIRRALCDTGQMIHSISDQNEIIDIFNNLSSLVDANSTYIRLKFTYEDPSEIKEDQEFVSVGWNDYAPNQININDQCVLVFDDLHLKIKKLWIARDPYRSAKDNGYLLAKFDATSDRDERFFYGDIELSYSQVENGFFKDASGKICEIDRQNLTSQSYVTSEGYLIIGTRWSCFDSDASSLLTDKFLGDLLKNQENENENFIRTGLSSFRCSPHEDFKWML